MTHKQITDEYSAHMYWLRNFEQSVKKSRIKETASGEREERLMHLFAAVDAIRDQLRTVYAEPLGNAVAFELEKTA
jgi:hypothetical protein